MTPTALIVDSFLPLARILATAFQQAGFITEVCAEGPLALLRARHRPCDVVVVSLPLADDASEAFGDQLRHTPGYEQTPLFVLTAECDVACRGAGIERWRAIEVLAKPFSPSHLVTAAAASLAATSVRPR